MFPESLDATRLVGSLHAIPPSKINFEPGAALEVLAWRLPEAGEIPSPDGAQAVRKYPFPRLDVNGIL